MSVKSDEPLADSLMEVKMTMDLTQQCREVGCQEHVASRHGLFQLIPLECAKRAGRMDGSVLS